MGACTAVKLSGDVPYWRSTPIRCECSRPPPAPKHPGAALMRFTAFPSSKPAMLRMLRDARCNRVVIVCV